MIDRLRQAGRDARNSSAAIILVLASVVSAFAAVVGLTSWVTVAAAVAAVLSGGQVLQKELVVPMRIRSVETATVPVFCGDSRGQRFVGTAFQIAANRWVTAQHVVADGDEILLRTKGERAPAQVLFSSLDSDITILSINNAWAWRASISRPLPDPGDQVRIVGWTEVGDGQRLRIAFDYLIQGQSENDAIAMAGAYLPRLGFSGAPVIDMRSGRVVGILHSRYSGDDPGGAALAFAAPISKIPALYH